jgi:hypothetical protein
MTSPSPRWINTPGSPPCREDGGNLEGAQVVDDPRRPVEMLGFPTQHENYGQNGKSVLLGILLTRFSQLLPFKDDLGAIFLDSIVIRSNWRKESI